MTVSKNAPLIVAMSGGVDSSVAALLLLEQGHRVEGLFMKNWEEDDDEEYCSAEQDLSDAREVCAQLGIPLHTANFAAEYWEEVFCDFLEGLRRGYTPNPDVLCNSRIKFQLFPQYARTLGAEYVATGMYARRGEQGSLLRGTAPDRDQSYFLHALREEQLRGTLFPLGEMTKEEVRSLARKNGLVTHEKKGSTGICFIGERHFAPFLSRWLPPSPGVMRSVDGQLLGTHRGLMYYTIGQRSGLGIGGTKNGGEEPWYVVDKQLASNTLVVAQGSNHPSLFHRSLGLPGINWIGTPPELPLRCSARIRYRQQDQSCELRLEGTGRFMVHFDTPQRAVTPGQCAVLYQGQRCLGGGVIEERLA